MAAKTFDPCQPLAVVTDPGASPSQLEGVEGGLLLWNRAAHAHLFLDDVARAASPVSSAVPAVPVHFQKAAAPSHGFYDDGAGEVFINTDLVDHARTITIAHELGHAFGLFHVAISRLSVMNAGNLEIEPTAADIDVLGSLWGVCPAPGNDPAP